MKYTSRGLRRREGTDRWEVILSHKDPVTREVIPTYHTVTARTKKQAERKRNELILELERRGTALSSKMTVRDYLSEFVAYKRGSDRLYKMFGLAPSDPFVLGTREPDSRPYNPTTLTKEFAAFCKTNGFKCTFHDLRHTFATFMIAEGVDVRTVSSYLGHANVAGSDKVFHRRTFLLL